MSQKYLDINIDIKHVPGKLNGFADAVSRVRPSKTLNTIFRKEYPTNILKGYMNAMAKWFEAHMGRYIRYHPTEALPEAPMAHWKHHSISDNIYANTKAWQGIPNWQDPVTKRLINYLRSLVVGNNSHSLTCALIDFAVLACQTGWRGIEWLQPVNRRRSDKLEFYEYDNATSKFENIIFACCIEDFTFKYK